MIQFSKRIVKWLCAFWFIGGLFGLILGAYAVRVEITTVDTVYNFLQLYIGAPVGATIIGYLCKSAFENVKKISKSNEGVENNGN